MRANSLSRVQLTRRVVLKTAVFVAILAAINPFAFRYYGLHVTLASQSLFAAINFALLVSFFSLEAWLNRRRETWDAIMERRFKTIMFALAALLVCLAIFLLFHR